MRCVLCIEIGRRHRVAAAAVLGRLCGGPALGAGKETRVGSLRQSVHRQLSMTFYQP